MEGGGRDGEGREWCEVRSEEEQELTHQGSLSLAHPLMGAGHHCLGIQLCSHVVDSWAVVFVCGCSLPFVLVRFCGWACTFVGGWSSPSMCGWLHWWARVFSMVVWLGPRGGS